MRTMTIITASQAPVGRGMLNLMSESTVNANSCCTTRVQHDPTRNACCALTLFHKKLKNVSCEYDRWVVETQLCKLRDTSDTLIGRACAMFQLKYAICRRFHKNQTHAMHFLPLSLRPKSGNSFHTSHRS